MCLNERVLGIISEIITEKAMLHLPVKIIFLNQYF